VLVNLRAEWPPFFGRFERLIEIVSTDEDDRSRARERYKFYRDRGYQIRTHDLGEAT
jgi:DNA polymerase-3 subunit chi